MYLTTTTAVLGCVQTWQNLKYVHRDYRVGIVLRQG